MKIARLLMVLSVALWLTGSGFAQEQQSAPQGRGMKMKAMHEEVQAEMKAMDERLDKLVIDMNTSATPDKKLEGVIAVVNEMVSQHKKMHEKMMHRWDEHRPGGGPKAEGKKNE